MKKILKYRHHANGQAFVRVDGKYVYLGKLNSPESQEAYRRVLNQIMDRRSCRSAPASKSLVSGPTISEVMLAYRSYDSPRLRWHETFQLLGY